MGTPCECADCLRMRDEEARREWYRDGLRAGRADRLMGHRSDYAMGGLVDLNPRFRAYSEGYAEGRYPVAE